jgi:lipopolysaccharide biosynthesis glycosyltransferase
MVDLQVACASDTRYVHHSAAMLHSLITQAGGHVIVHYLHGPDLTGTSADQLEAMIRQHDAEIVFHEIAHNRVAHFPDSGRFGPAMWYRALLPELLPAVDRILYLDVDVIVTDEIAPLWQVDLSDAYLAAVTNVSVDAYRDHPLQLGLRRNEYFNSGVLMLNLELMRETEFPACLVDCLHDRPELPFPDQDALNLAVGHRKVLLHPRWNCMNSLTTYQPIAIEILGESAVREALARPAIRHFEGPDDNKPWHLLHDRTDQRLYQSHRRATPWPEYELEGRTVRNRLRRALLDLGSKETPTGG